MRTLSVRSSNYQSERLLVRPQAGLDGVRVAGVRVTVGCQRAIGLQGWCGHGSVLGSVGRNQRLGAMTEA